MKGSEIALKGRAVERRGYYYTAWPMADGGAASAFAVRRRSPLGLGPSPRRGRPEEYWTSDYAYSLTELCVCVLVAGITGVTYKFTLSKYDSLGRASASALTALLTVVAQLFTTSRQSTSAQGLEVHEVVGGQHISHTSVRKFY